MEERHSGIFRTVFPAGWGDGRGAADSGGVRHPADGFRGYGFPQEGGIVFFRAGHAGEALYVRLYGAGAGPLAQYLLRQRGAADDTAVPDEQAHLHPGEILPHGAGRIPAA